MKVLDFIIYYHSSYQVRYNNAKQTRQAIKQANR